MSEVNHGQNNAAPNLRYSPQTPTRVDWPYLRVDPHDSERTELPAGLGSNLLPPYLDDTRYPVQVVTPEHKGTVLWVVERGDRPTLIYTDNSNASRTNVPNAMHTANPVHPGTNRWSHATLVGLRSGDTRFAWFAHKDQALRTYPLNWKHKTVPVTQPDGSTVNRDVWWAISPDSMQMFQLYAVSNPH